MPHFLIAATLLVALLATAGYLMSNMPGRSFQGPRSPASPAERQLADRLRKHVETLSADIGERHIWQFGQLQQAAAYIEAEFAKAGLAQRSISYQVEGKQARNLEAEIKGSQRPAEVIVIGAHYDSLLGTVGANDNGSGVALLLELARHFRSRPLARTVRFVAFVNEEPPFFKTERMGSRVYVGQRIIPGQEQVVAMLSLETLGYYSEEPGSQKFPLPPLAWFYPDRGDFLALVGNLSSRRLLKRSLRTFRDQVDFPSEGIVAPRWLTGIDWSDHWAFWRIGIPAIMVTDTALFRYPYYHTAEDTSDKLDYTAMARIARGLQAVLRELGGEGGDQR